MDPHPVKPMSDYAPPTATVEYRLRGDQEARSTPIDEVNFFDLLGSVPIRKSANHPGQPNITGYIYDPDADELTWRESNLEASRFLAAQFDPRIVRLVSQPFLCRYNDGTNSSHVPDCLTLLSDGTLKVFNVKARAEYDVDVQAQMARFAEEIAPHGLTHEMWHELPHTTWHILRRLKRVRLPDAVHTPTTQLVERLWEPGDTYGALRERATIAGAHAGFVPYAIDYLIWTRRFVIDMEARLDSSTELHARATPDAHQN